jgi:hypothetical protein
LDRKGPSLKVFIKSKLPDDAAGIMDIIGYRELSQQYQVETTAQGFADNGTDHQVSFTVSKIDDWPWLEDEEITRFGKLRQESPDGKYTKVRVSRIADQVERILWLNRKKQSGINRIGIRQGRGDGEIGLSETRLCRGHQELCIGGKGMFPFDKKGIQDIQPEIPETALKTSARDAGGSGSSFQFGIDAPTIHTKVYGQSVRNDAGSFPLILHQYGEANPCGYTGGINAGLCAESLQGHRIGLRKKAVRETENCQKKDSVDWTAFDHKIRLACCTPASAVDIRNGHKQYFIFQSCQDMIVGTCLIDQHAYMGSLGRGHIYARPAHYRTDNNSM